MSDKVREALERWISTEIEDLRPGDSYERGFLAALEKVQRILPTLTAIAERESAQPVARPHCREVPPGNGFCDQCAAGHYERCRYVVPLSEQAKWDAHPPERPPEIPREPTEAMIKAGCVADVNWDEGKAEENMRAWWIAMYDAAALAERGKS